MVSKKSARKAARKAAIRAAGKTIVTVTTVAKTRRDWLRRLRVIKLKRREIVKDMQVVTDAIDNTIDALHRHHVRSAISNGELCDEAIRLLHKARRTATEMVDGYRAFAKRRIYVIEEKRS